MAARENQGLQITLIIFVMLTIIYLAAAVHTDHEHEAHEHESGAHAAA